MKKRILFLVLTAILLAAGIFPVVAQAQAGEADVQVTAEMHFPLLLIFNISAQGGTDFNDIRVLYTVDRMKNAQVITEEVVSFTPGKEVAAQHIIDMRQSGGMPPGSSLTYWVKAVDSSEHITETLPQKLEIKDNRYGWKSLQQGLVVLYWYKGDDGFARELMDAAQHALGTLSENSGASLTSPVSLYIYANSSDLQGAMIFAQEWTGGVAYTEYGIIAIGIGTSQGEIDWGKRAISHELTHLVVHQATFNSYNTIPPWLDEGLAMNSEGELQSQFTQALDNADGNYVTVRSLSSPFSAHADQAILAYAESYKIVRYLIDTYGREKMFELLNAFKNGSGYDEAVENVYGFSMAELNALWQAAPVAAP